MTCSPHCILIVILLGWYYHFLHFTGGWGLQRLSNLPKVTKLAYGGQGGLAPEPMISVTVLPLNQNGGLQGGEETEGLNGA